MPDPSHQLSRSQGAQAGGLLLGRHHHCRSPFCFAGIWRGDKLGYGKGDGPVEIYSLLTSTPNELVRDFHPDRMPVILDRSNWETWLHGSTEEVASLLAPFPADRMEIIDAGEDLKAEPWAAMDIRACTYAQLRQLCWNRPEDTVVDDETALAPYERNWRFVDHGAVTPREQALQDDLVTKFGNGHFLAS